MPKKPGTAQIPARRAVRTYAELAPRRTPNRLLAKLELRALGQPGGSSTARYSMRRAVAASSTSGLAGVDPEGKFGSNAEETKLMSRDVIVDEVRRVRDRLVKKYGGLDGWIEHLQQMDRDRARKAKRQSVKKGNRRQSPSSTPKHA